MDVFTRISRNQVVIDELNAFIVDRGLRVFVWLLMSNKLYLIVKTAEGSAIEKLVDEFRHTTSRALFSALQKEKDTNAPFILRELAHHEINMISVWEDNVVYECLEEEKQVDEHIHAIHNVPVEEKMVENPEHYLFGSAGDFLGWKGYVDVDMEI